MEESKKSYEESIEELSLMLMYLTRRREQENYGGNVYRELSWKGYDFDALDKMEKEDLLWQPRSRKGYAKYLYLTESGRSRARALLQKYGFSERPLSERFTFREILPEEAAQAAEIERICFAPDEACTEAMIRERAAAAPELFLVAADKENGRLAGFLNGIATDEWSFRDEFFSDASLHRPQGKNIMLLGLDVLPQYRGQGLARELMFQYLRREEEKGRNLVVLTCEKAKVKMYKKMGFEDRGLSDSAWGGSQWHEMTCVL